jgi:hypothetical protein
MEVYTEKTIEGEKLILRKVQAEKVLTEVHTESGLY